MPDRNTLRRTTGHLIDRIQPVLQQLPGYEMVTTSQACKAVLYVAYRIESTDDLTEEQLSEFIEWLRLQAYRLGVPEKEANYFTTT